MGVKPEIIKAAPQNAPRYMNVPTMSRIPALNVKAANGKAAKISMATRSGKIAKKRLRKRSNRDVTIELRPNAAPNP